MEAVRRGGVADAPVTWGVLLAPAHASHHDVSGENCPVRVFLFAGGGESRECGEANFYWVVAASAQALIVFAKA